MPKTLTKAEDVDLSWLSWHAPSGVFVGTCHNQIVTMSQVDGQWFANINGESVENEAGTAADSWPSQEEAAQVVMAICKIMQDEEEAEEEE